MTIPEIVMSRAVSTLPNASGVNSRPSARLSSVIPSRIHDDMIFVRQLGRNRCQMLTRHVH